jgi:alpha-L-rhamnosidase
MTITRIFSRPPTGKATASDIRAAAEAFSVDELPDVPPLLGEPQPLVEWVYAAGQYELAVLDRLVREGFAANKSVHYAPNYGQVARLTQFRRKLQGAEGAVSICCPEQVSFSVDGIPAESIVDGDVHRVRVPVGSQELRFKVRTSGAVPAAFTAASEDGFAPGSTWEAQLAPDDGSGGIGQWIPTMVREGQLAIAPHLQREPTVELTPLREDGIYTLGAPVLGRPIIVCAGIPRVSSGESLQEALAPSSTSETRHDMRQLPDGRWTTVHELGFRYLVVHDAVVHDLVIEASVHPVSRRGAFVTSDARLNEIWSISAYTLRLCMHELILDGIKRDRMPWMGDQALNTVSNAYAFADAAMVRDGLVALGQPRHGYVNGISDYSLWWLINTFSYQRYFADSGHLEREKDRIHAFTENLASYADERGIFRPRHEQDSFPDAAEGGIFIDWGVEVDVSKDLTALQILWYWALRSAAEVLDVAAHPGARRWAQMAERVSTTLMQEAWDARKKAWREYLGGESTASPYANMLAILSGLTPGDAPGVRDALLGTERVGTPFMTSFALRALARTGSQDIAVDRIRSLWGTMVEAGSRTFWEEFGSPDTNEHEMYGRPFGKSLCHAWSSGPAALLPEIVLGIRPLADGWEQFTVDPALGSLEWAAAVVPTPHGDISVYADGRSVTVTVPDGTTLVRQDSKTFGPSTSTRIFSSAEA